MKNLLPTLCLLLCAAPAAAADDPLLAELLAKGPEALLVEADKRISNFQDQELTVEMSIFSGGKLEQKAKLTTFTKGSARIVRFDEPADVRGMGILIKARAIYVKIPGSPKVRRVAGHSRKQGMMGSDYAFDDTSMLALAEDYTAELAGQTDADVKLVLTRKPGSEMNYPKLEVLISKSDLVRHHTRFFDDDGKELKTETRTELRKNEKGHYTHGTVVMKDSQRDHHTENKVVAEKVDQGLEDRFFQQKTLLKNL